MSDVLEFHAAHRLVPVVVVDRADRALPLAETLSSGGLPSAEVTLRTPAALSAISAMAAHPGFVVGAGPSYAPSRWSRPSPPALATSSRPATARPSTASAGNSTSSSSRASRRPPSCRRRSMPAGSVVKFFPAAAAGGAAMVAALSAPFPSARFVPTGGIGAADLADYLRLPAVLAVGGTWLAPRDRDRRR